MTSTRKRRPPKTPRTGRPPIHPPDTQQRRIIITLTDAQWAELCELMDADTHARGLQILTALQGAKEGT